jgi:hypothetical protein
MQVTKKKGSDTLRNAQTPVLLRGPSRERAFHNPKPGSTTWLADGNASLNQMSVLNKTEVRDN